MSGLGEVEFRASANAQLQRVGTESQAQQVGRTDAQPQAHALGRHRSVGKTIGRILGAIFSLGLSEVIIKIVDVVRNARAGAAAQKLTQEIADHNSALLADADKMSAIQRGASFSIREFFWGDTPGIQRSLPDSICQNLPDRIQAAIRQHPTKLAPSELQAFANQVARQVADEYMAPIREHNGALANSMQTDTEFRAQLLAAREECRARLDPDGSLGIEQESDEAFLRSLESTVRQDRLNNLEKTNLFDLIDKTLHTQAEKIFLDQNLTPLFNATSSLSAMDRSNLSNAAARLPALKAFFSASVGSDFRTLAADAKAAINLRVQAFINEKEVRTEILSQAIPLFAQKTQCDASTASRLDCQQLQDHLAYIMSDITAAHPREILPKELWRQSYQPVLAKYVSRQADCYNKVTMLQQEGKISDKLAHIWHEKYLTSDDSLPSTILFIDKGLELAGRQLESGLFSQLMQQAPSASDEHLVQLLGGLLDIQQTFAESLPQELKGDARSIIQDSITALCGNDPAFLNGLRAITPRLSQLESNIINQTQARSMNAVLSAESKKIIDVLAFTRTLSSTLLVNFSQEQ